MIPQVELYNNAVFGSDVGVARVASRHVKLVADSSKFVLIYHRRLVWLHLEYYFQENSDGSYYVRT